MSMIRIGVLALCCLSTVLTGCAFKHKKSEPFAMQVPQASGSNEPVFGRGDHLELVVDEDTSFNGIFEVREGGYVLIPKLGRVSVAGLKRSAAEEKLRQALQNQQLRHATVYVEHLGARATGGSELYVYLTGAVARPGQHSVPLVGGGRAPGAYEVLLMAGGLAKFANDRHVCINRLRDGLRHQMYFDLSKVRNGQAEDIPVSEGDIIQVPEKVFGF